MKLSVAQVTLWTLGVLLTYLLTLPLVAAVMPGLKEDLVIQAAVLSAVNLGACALFAGRRPGRSWSETFAIRKTSGWLVALAAALGISTCLPASVLATWLERFIPMIDVEHSTRDIRSFSHGVALYTFVAGIGPFSEELIFRGAFYTGLRPIHSSIYAGWMTSLLFTVIHLNPSASLALLILGGLLATVRAVSGSLWPSLLLHVAFNATALGMPFSRPELQDPSAGLVIGCVVASAVVLGAITWIARASGSADRARQVDLEPDPGLGESHP